MAETVVRNLIEADLDHALGPQRFPGRRPLGGPSARPPGGTTAEAFTATQVFQVAGQGDLVDARETRRMADVVEFSCVVIETKEKRADDRRV